MLVSWSRPESQVPFEPDCYEYQLDIGDGVRRGCWRPRPTRLSSASRPDDRILSKTGSSQRNVGGAVLHAAGRGPRPHLQGEDKDAGELQLSRTPSVERVERVEQRCRSVPLVRQRLTFPPCRVFDVCLRIFSRGSVGFPPQLAGDRPNFAGTTHDPPGCPAFGAVAEVESPFVIFISL